jgi:hypothetical protein
VKLGAQLYIISQVLCGSVLAAAQRSASLETQSSAMANNHPSLHCDLDDLWTIFVDSVSSIDQIVFQKWHDLWARGKTRHESKAKQSKARGEGDFAAQETTNSQSGTHNGQVLEWYKQRTQERKVEMLCRVMCVLSCVHVV